jgi:predicted transcriptional regulator YheO
MGLYEERVKRLHDHVIAHEKKVEDPNGTTELTNKQIMAMLDEKGIEYDKKANNATLLALLESVSGGQNNSEGAE